MVVLALVLSSASITKSQNKLFVYYPTWAAYTMPPSDLKFPSGIKTYYMHFSAHVSTTAPYFSVVVPGNTDSSDLAYRQRELIDTCHHAGQKVLLSITAQDNSLGDVAGNVTQRKAFVSSVCSYLKRKGYDGVDLDWEINLSSANVAAMAKEFRDTLNTWSTPGVLVMSVLTDPFTYPSWSFYDIAAMNQYLDAYFTMSYGMHAVERQADALGNAGSVWRCMFDAPYVRPTGIPWSGYTGGYWAANFKENSIVKWMARGADAAKIGVGLWNGGTRMLNSSSSSIPGSVISYGTANFPTYPQVLAGTSNYDAATDSWWGIVGGLYTSWIDSAGAYKRTKWAKDTVHTNVFMLYDAYSGFIDLPARYGRQPHFDAMVNAINAVQGVLPTGTFTASPLSLPVGGGNVTLTWTSNGATSASIDQGVGSVALSGGTTVTVGQTKTFTLTLSNGSGSTSYAVRVNVEGGLPTGTFTASPLSLPVGGGNVTLTWASSGATSATIDQGVGSVALSGNTTVAVSQTKTFTLTLSNGSGSMSYAVQLNVALATTTGKIMLLGDSISELDWQGGYRSQLYHLLQVGGYSFDFVGRSTTNHDATNLGFTFPTAYWDHEGYSNATIEVSSTYTWKNNLRTALTAGRPDVVCVMLGTNDVFSTIRNATQVRNAMSAFLDSIWAFNPSTKVVLSTMPRVFGYPTALPIIQSANALWPAMVAAKQSGGRSITLVDNYAALALSSDFVDGVHPSVGGYVKMANAWFPAVVAALSSSPLPTGTFSVAPDSLPAGGGSVTLSWTSSNAQTASLDHGIGSVSVNGSSVVTVGATTTHTLTLTNQSGSQQYQANVFVVLPGGQGEQDITSQASQPIALITNPTGGGSRNIEVIRDGDTPLVGSSNEAQNYDTYTGGGPRSFDWIGYQFSAQHTFSRVLFQEGMQLSDGGWFTTLNVQVRVNGVWVNAQNQQSTPAYAGANGINYETYEQSFTPIAGDGIRIAGTPGGSGHFISVGELRAFESQVGPPPSAPQLLFPTNGSTGQPTSVVLRWNRVGNASDYHLQVSVDSLFASTVIDGAQLADTMQQASGLSSLTKYFWRVSSRGLAGEGAYSDVWRFTTLSGLSGSPVLTSPSNNATNQSLSPTLRWGVVSGAVSYHLQVSRDSAFSTTIVNDSTIVNRSRQVSGLTKLTKYFWRVRSKNAVGYGAFSSKWNFTTKKGRRDVTSNGSLISMVTEPIGQGNPNREVIRDGVTPPLGHTNPLDQFDTFTGSSRQSDWIGYSFPATHRFSNLEFQEGIESDSGGWFASLNVQVRVNNNWIDVQNLITTPPYVPNNGDNFESYELNFDPVVGDGVRIVGAPGGTYTYISVAELRVRDEDSSLVEDGGSQRAPNKYILDQNYPNPFNPTTRISFLVPEAGYVSLTVYNVLGQKVATLVDGVMQSGKQTVEFSGDDLADGMYMYILRAGSFSDMKKMILLK